MSLSSIYLDPDIIPDSKEKSLKESFELFRRACNLHDAHHLLLLQLKYDNKLSEKIKMIYNLSIMQLEKERNEIIKIAIVKYQESENGL